MNYYLLYGANKALCAFTATRELKFYIFDLRGKIVQNTKILPVSQDYDLSSKLNPTRQYKSKGMLGFQNKALNMKLLKFHVNREKWAYREKYDFQRKLIF